MIKWFLDLDVENKVALLGIFVTAIFSLFSLFFSVRNNKSVYYVSSITKSRIEWIQTLRKLVSEFISLVDVNDIVFYSPYQNESEECGQYLMKCKQKETEIKLLLNATDSLDRDIITKLNAIRQKFVVLYEDVIKHNRELEGAFFFTERQEQYKKELYRLVYELEKQIQLYLKAEWNRVKYESQGKTYEKAIFDFDLEELEEKYNNPSYKNKIWKRRFIVIWVKIKKIIPICIVVDIISYIKNKKFSS